MPLHAEGMTLLRVTGFGEQFSPMLEILLLVWSGLLLWLLGRAVQLVLFGR